MRLFKLITRAFAVVLSLAVVASAFVGCAEAKYRADKSSKSDMETVAKVSGYDISYELYRYLFANYNLALYESNEAAKADGYEETFEAIEEALCELYAIYAVCEANNVDTDSIYINDCLENYMVEIIDSFEHRRDYLDSLKEGYSTDAVFRFLAKTDFCESSLFDVLYSDDNGIIDTSNDTVQDYFESDDCFAYYMLEFYRDGSSERREYAEELYNRVLATTTAKEFREFYGHSVTTYSETIDGFLFCVGRGEIEEKYEDIILELDVGEISELIEGEGAYFVFRRAQKNLSDMNKDNDSFVYVKTSYVNFKMREIIDEYADEMELSYIDREGLLVKLETELFEK